MPVRRQQTRYNTVPRNDEIIGTVADTVESVDVRSRSGTARINSIATTYSSVPDTDIELETIQPEDNSFSVTILDFCHKKFAVTVQAGNTVFQLKENGALVHRIPVSQQRLIYQGKLLEDDATLQSCGIDKEGVIVHLFPRPRVVVINNGEEENHDTPEDTSDTAARVPTIILDAEEAAQRSHILVLGSMDYIEAVNNVKLFS